MDFFNALDFLYKDIGMPAYMGIICGFVIALFAASIIQLIDMWVQKERKWGWVISFGISLVAGCFLLYFGLNIEAVRGSQIFLAWTMITSLFGTIVVIFIFIIATWISNRKKKVKIREVDYLVNTGIKESGENQVDLETDQNFKQDLQAGKSGRLNRWQGQGYPQQQQQQPMQPRQPMPQGYPQQPRQPMPQGYPQQQQQQPMQPRQPMPQGYPQQQQQQLRQQMPQGYPQQQQQQPRQQPRQQMPQGYPQQQPRQQQPRQPMPQGYPPQQRQQQPRQPMPQGYPQQQPRQPMPQGYPQQRPTTISMNPNKNASGYLGPSDAERMFRRNSN